LQRAVSWRQAAGHKPGRWKYPFLGPALGIGLLVPEEPPAFTEATTDRLWKDLTGDAAGAVPGRLAIEQVA